MSCTVRTNTALNYPAGGTPIAWRARRQIEDANARALEAARRVHDCAGDARSYRGRLDTLQTPPSRRSARFEGPEQGTDLFYPRVGVRQTARSASQRVGGARTGAGGCGTGLRTGATADEGGDADGGDAEILSTAPCWIAWSLVISVASLSTSCRITASPRDMATS